jgi:hypothetical protein
VSEPITITDPSQRAAAVGERVRIVGVQTRTKIPSVCGVDVDGDDDLADREVEVVGILEVDTVEDADPYSANRGAGVFYRVVDPETGRLAHPRGRAAAPT